ncbi:MAG: S1 family peptidase [Polyangiales bacterium]
MRVAIFALFLAGCSVEAAPVGTRRAPIINGVASTSEDDATVFVGQLSSAGDIQGSCSGVMVAENLVLTARHCVSKTSDAGIECGTDGSPIAGGAVGGDYPANRLGIVVGPTFTSATELAAVGTQIFTTGAKNLCNNDIALILLDKKIAGAKLASLRMGSPPVRGEKVLVVGWGVSNNSGMDTRMRRANVTIRRVGPASSSSDGPLSPREFEVGESICSGDSGGPALSMDTGAVLGVVSRGGNGAPYDPSTDPDWTECVDSAGYKTLNIYTRVDGFADLFSTAFAAAGTEPWLEGQPDPRLSKSDPAPSDPAPAATDPPAETSSKGSCAYGREGSPGLGFLFALGALSAKRRRRAAAKRA